MSNRFPLDRVRREALREHYRQIYLEQALRAACSLVCMGQVRGRGHHAGTPGGCANDGSGCMCACHDLDGIDG